MSKVRHSRVSWVPDGRVARTSVRRKRPGQAPRSELEDDAAESALERLVSNDDPERATLEAEQARSLEAALAALPPLYREVLVLRELEDLSYREIATITDTPLGTVMSRLARARAALRTQWQTMTGGSADALP